MKKYLTIIIALTFTVSICAEVYRAPKLGLKRQAKRQYKVMKESGYHNFKVHQYKVNEKPVRKRDIASKKNGGRLPSSKTVEYFDNRVELWAWQK
jgi:hypothetical protein